MNSVNQNRKTVAPFINVTPMIDVLLVLLVIFMVIAPARPSKFDARIPEKPEPKQDMVVCDLSLVVTVNNAGGYALNTEPYNTLGDLQARLLDALDGRPEDRKAVFLKAPRALNYGEVVKVIDVMKTAGAAPIGLQTENLDQ